ncbi:hypothetical protein ACWIGL_30930 [Streptomyces albidoflavus]|nr:hypothetical protein [Escherichia coli]
MSASPVVKTGEEAKYHLIQKNISKVGLAIDQIAQSGLSFLKVIYCLAQLFRVYPIMCSRPAVSCNLYLFPA